MDRPPWRVPLLAFVVSRALLLFTVHLALTRHAVHLRPDEWRAFPDNAWLDGWARWDSGWYWDIASNGLSDSGPAPNANFFPLYPYLSLLVATPFRAFLPFQQAFFAGGLLVAHVAFLIALRGVQRLACALTDEPTATRAVWLLALFPFSFFFGAVYAESLYLALVVWSFYAAHQRRWGLASILMGFVGLTRVVAFVPIAALGLEYLRQRDFRPSRIDRQAAWLLVAPLGFLGHLAYLGVRFGDPLLPYHTHLDRGQTFTFSHLTDLLEILPGQHGAVYVELLWWLALPILGLVLGIVVWRRFGAAHAAYVLLSVGLAAVAGFVGIGRYVSVLFPLFIAAATLLRGRVFVAVCVAFIPFLVAFADGFATWQWVN